MACNFPWRKCVGLKSHQFSFLILNLLGCNSWTIESVKVPKISGLDFWWLTEETLLADVQFSESERATQLRSNKTVSYVDCEVPQFLKLYSQSWSNRTILIWPLSDELSVGLKYWGWIWILLKLRGFMQFFKLVMFVWSVSWVSISGTASHLVGSVNLMNLFWV